MTPEEEALAVVLDTLERLSIPHMVTGSIASSYYGRPRTTNDADVVIDPSVASLDALVDMLTNAEFYVDSDAARHALASRRQFNAIHKRSGAKIDLIVKKTRAFSDCELARRTRHDLPFHKAVSLVSAEDAVLSKLAWARAGGDSERQIADAAGIVMLNPSLDGVYLDHWAAELGIHDLWERVRRGE